MIGQNQMFTPFMKINEKFYVAIQPSEQNKFKSTFCFDARREFTQEFHLDYIIDNKELELCGINLNEE